MAEQNSNKQATSPRRASRASVREARRGARAAASGGRRTPDGVRELRDGDQPASVSGHERAKVQVRWAKGWGGLGSFALAALLSARASVPLPGVLERALVFGVVGYLVGWAVSLLVWRELVTAEARALRDALAPPEDAPGADGSEKTPPRRQQHAGGRNR
jgi:hypothetical protein